MKALSVVCALVLLASVIGACNDRPVQRGGSNPIRNPTPEEQGAALGDAYLGFLRDAELLVRSRPPAAELRPKLDTLIEGYTRLFRSLEGRKAQLTESDQTRVDDSVALRFRSARPVWNADWLSEAVVFYQSRDVALATTLSGLNQYVPSY